MFLLNFGFQSVVTYLILLWVSGSRQQRTSLQMCRLKKSFHVIVVRKERGLHTGIYFKGILSVYFPSTRTLPVNVICWGEGEFYTPLTSQITSGQFYALSSWFNLQSR